MTIIVNNDEWGMQSVRATLIVKYAFEVCQMQTQTPRHYSTTEVVKSLKVMKEKRVNKLFIRLLVWFDPGKMIGLKMKRTRDRECHFPRKKNLIDRPNRTLCKLSKRTYYL